MDGNKTLVNFRLGDVTDVLSRTLCSPVACQTYIGLAIFLIGIVTIDRAMGRTIRRYWSVTFRTDLIYMFLVVGGIYGLIQQPVVTFIDHLLRKHASFLYLDLLRELPLTVQLPIFLIAVDFCRYWKHRLLHSFPVLWAFHCIHHAPSELNFLTNYRIHLFEFIADGLITLVPVVLLGIPPSLWLPATFLLMWYTSLHHTDLYLRLGWFERVFVSPHFHRVHHSANPSDFNCNYGAALSVWDSLFSTAKFHKECPSEYGIPDLQISDTLLGQAVFPFRHLFDLIELGQPAGLARPRAQPPS